MGDVDDFLAEVLPRQHETETAIHRGDAGPRKAFCGSGVHVDAISQLANPVKTNAKLEAKRPRADSNRRSPP